MSEENETAEQDGRVEKPPRKPRKASRYVVLKQSIVEGGEVYHITAEAKSPTGCVKQIKDKKISGELLIACVHRTLSVKLETVEVLKGV